MERRRLLQALAAMTAPTILRTGRASTRLRVGVPLPLTGVQAEVATDMREGYTLAFDRVKRSGGVAIEPVWADDRSVPDETARIAEVFARDDSILALSGIVGTPHAKAALPIASKLGLPVVGLRSGSMELRSGNKTVFHLRASFGDELTKMVRMIHGSGLDRLSVVYSDDAFGREAVAHVSAVAAGLGLAIVASLPAERNGKDIESVVERAAGQQTKANAMLLLMIAAPMLRGLKRARKLSFVLPVFCMSFCATRYLAETTDPVVTGLGLVSAFPLPRSALGGLAAQFREDGLRSKIPGITNSLTALEGYMYGAVIANALERAAQPSRLGLASALRVPMRLEGELFQFDTKNVGYHYLRIIHKSASGPLRA